MTLGQPLSLSPRKQAVANHSEILAKNLQRLVQAEEKQGKIIPRSEFKNLSLFVK